MRTKLALSDVLAFTLAVGIGVPFAASFFITFRTGEQVRTEAPLRGLLGNQAYDALRVAEERGEMLPQHYLGQDRLAPDFTLRNANGTSWSLADRRGKVVVMNFWTVTCGPCIEEMPSFVRLARILRDRDDIELVTVSVDRDWDTVRTVIPDNVPLTVLLDPDRSVVNGQFGTRLFPETWVIDPDGVIRLRVDGQRDWSSALALDVFESYL